MAKRGPCTLVYFFRQAQAIAKGKQAFVLIKREAATATRQAIGRWGIDGDASARVIMWIWYCLALDLVSEGTVAPSVSSGFLGYIRPPTHGCLEMDAREIVWMDSSVSTGSRCRLSVPHAERVK